MQRSCETVKIGGSFLFWLLAPRGIGGPWNKSERVKGLEGGDRVAVVGRIDGKAPPVTEQVYLSFDHWLVPVPPA